MSQDQEYQTGNICWRTSARMGYRVECQETGNLSRKGEFWNHGKFVHSELKPKQKAEVNWQLLAESDAAEESQQQQQQKGMNRGNQRPIKQGGSIEVVDRYVAEDIYLEKQVTFRVSSYTGSNKQCWSWDIDGSVAKMDPDLTNKNKDRRPRLRNRQWELAVVWRRPLMKNPSERNSVPFIQ